MISLTNGQVELDQQPESKLIDNISSSCFLSKVAQDGVSHLYNQKTLKNQQTEALKYLNKLLKLVTK